MNRLNVSALMAVSCAAAAVCGSALAVPLAPGEQVNLNGTTSGQVSWLPGGVIGPTASLPFEIVDSQGGPVFQGTVTSDSVLSNELGTFRIDTRLKDMQAIGNRAVSRVDLVGFGPLQTNVNYSTSGLGDVGPSAASRTASGEQVSFFFNPFLFVSQDSYFFWIHTNAPAYRTDGQLRITLNTGESVVVTGVRVPVLTDCPADTNGDGVVNFTDLNAVLSDFGEDCN
jgi:hypothetical protein